jgi:hypothetical protein
MAQASTLKTYNTFVRGIVTEAGPLTYPENASLDEENCVLNRDGSRQRRLGMDFEDDFVLRSVTVLPDDAVASFRWKNAANDVNNQFAVVQAGQQLFIFDASATSISANLIATVNLASYITGKTPIQVASGLGYLFVVGGTSAPLYLSYNPGTGAVSITQYTIKIRDFFGLDDGLAVNTTPASLSTEHNYNLLNQGWTSALITSYHTTGVYPSNAQQWFVGKDSNDDFQAALLNKQDFGTTPAPKGRFIIDAFARSTSRNAASGLTTPADIETGYPSCVAFSFQRVFYAGCKSVVSAPTTTRPNYTGFVFYSRVLRSVGDAGQAHQDADPTSEIDSELVDTDGGFINIPDSGQIYRLMPKGDQMLVFAEQGIWAIMGDEGGFRGTSFQVVKLTDFGVLSGTSIVDTESSALYWNRGGIYLLAPDEATGRLNATNITEKSIQTLYNSIDQVSKTTAVGSFDPVNRRVTWMYNDQEDYTGSTFRNKYNKELVLDMVLEAFYKNSISAHSEPSPYIAGYLETPDFLLRQEGIRNRGDSVTKYLTVQFIDPDTNSASVSFAYYRNPSLRDWVSSDGMGTSYLSYCLTGDEIMGDVARRKEAPYLFMHFKRTELTAIDNGSGEAKADNPSGMFVQCRWDWSDHSDSGKWQEAFQAYRLTRPYILEIGQPINYGHEVITTRNRITGSGKSLRIYMYSDGDKDFYLYGWATKFSGRSQV